MFASVYVCVCACMCLCLCCVVCMCVYVCVYVWKGFQTCISNSDFDCQIQCMYFITVTWQSLCWDIKHVTYVLAFYTLLSSNPILNLHSHIVEDVSLLRNIDYVQNCKLLM